MFRAYFILSDFAMNNPNTLKKIELRSQNKFSGDTFWIIWMRTTGSTVPISQLIAYSFSVSQILEFKI